MSVFGLFRGLFKPKKAISYTFTDEDREMSAELRRLRSDLRQTKQMLKLKTEIAELRQMTHDLTDYDDEEGTGNNDFLDTMLQNLLSGAMSGKAPNEQTPIHTDITITDDDIRNLIEQNTTKRQRAKASKLSDDMLKKIASVQFPGLDSATLDRAVIIFRSMI